MFQLNVPLSWQLKGFCLTFILGREQDQHIWFSYQHPSTVVIFVHLASVSSIVHLIVGQADHQTVAILHWRDLWCGQQSIVNEFWSILAMVDKHMDHFLMRTLTLESEFMGLSPKARMVEPFFQMMMKSSSTSTCHIHNLFVTFKPKPQMRTKIDGWVLRDTSLVARLNIWQSNLIDGFPTRLKILNG